MKGLLVSLYWYHMERWVKGKSTVTKSSSWHSARRVGTRWKRHHARTPPSSWGASARPNSWRSSSRRWCRCDGNSWRTWTSCGANAAASFQRFASRPACLTGSGGAAQGGPFSWRVSSRSLSPSSPSSPSSSICLAQSLHDCQWREPLPFYAK